MEKEASPSLSIYSESLCDCFSLKCLSFRPLNAFISLKSSLLIDLPIFSWKTLPGQFHCCTDDSSVFCLNSSPLSWVPDPQSKTTTDIPHEHLQLITSQTKISIAPHLKAIMLFLVSNLYHYLRSVACTILGHWPLAYQPESCRFCPAIFLSISSFLSLLPLPRSGTILSLSLFYFL